MSHSILPLHHLPNSVTLLRLFLVWPTVGAILERRFDLALLLFLLAGVSDALDGFLAKRFGWQSHLGALLDPIADKCLLVSCYWATFLVGVLPLWFVALIFLRDLAILAGTAYLLVRDPGLEIRPSLLSKLNTIFQILYLLLLLNHLSFSPLPEALLQGVQVAVILSTLTSGAHYAVAFYENISKEEAHGAQRALRSRWR